ncbi:MAG: CDP-alcohol phosphatidyltransferase family protein [Bryobacterales bacterium]|nr:CDP-alcohol phosphatidyltransferase family protein [Bryobacterales bacterium]
MPSVYDLKPRFQALLRPIVILLAAIGATANQITIATCLISIALGVSLTYGPKHWFLLPVWLFLRMALNAIDGMLAKEHNQVTRVGALLNEITDVIADAALFLPFIAIFGPLWTALLVYLSTLTEFTSVVILSITGARPNHGPMGKSDRALVLGILAAWLALGFSVHEVVPMLLALVLVATVYNRARNIS